MRGGGIDLQPHWDLVFILNDPFVLENPIPYFQMGTLPALRDIQKTYYTKLPPDTWFKTIGYFPVDSPVKPHWVESAINLVDMPVTYTQYGYDEIVIADMLLDNATGVKPKIIPHGNDFNDFHPLETATVEQFKKDYFGSRLQKETYIVTVVGRNQRRKDIPRAMKIFKEFQKRRPDAFLYIHAEEQENWGSLAETAQQFNLRLNQDWGYPQDFIATKGIPQEVLNGIYNASDVHLSATQGEGWGLPITEAMATKTLNLAPAHTAISELFNLPNVRADRCVCPSAQEIPTLKLRGIPLANATTSSEWTCHGAPDLERIRPLANVDDAVAKLLWIYDNPDQTKPIINRAYKWIKTLDWDVVADQWDQLLQKAYADLQKERQSPQKTAAKWSKIKIPTRKPR
jgi:glycosyltransferase involved in cell wall biosynthesis